MFSVAKRQFSTSPVSKLAKFNMIGRLGSDATKAFHGENVIYKYNVATSKVLGGTPEWFTITKFEESPGFEKVFKKGALIHIEGDIVPNNYLKDDVKVYSINFVQKSFNVISFAKAGEEASESEQ